MIKCISFDFDRTLAHVTPTTPDLIQRLLAQKGIIVTKDELKQGSSKVFQNLPENLKQQLNIFGTLSKEERIQFIKEYNKIRVDMLEIQNSCHDIEELKTWLANQIFIIQKKVLYDDVVETIKQLNRKKIKQYVLSGNHSDGIIELLEQNNIINFFEKIITVDKYNPQKIDNYKILLEHSKLQPSEILHVGDELKTDGIGARNYNLNVLIIRREEELVFSENLDQRFNTISKLTELFNYI